MSGFGCTHDDMIDGGGNLVNIADASHDFGEGAIVVSCPCGGWIVEDAAGRVLARSEESISIFAASAAEDEVAHSRAA